MADKMADVSRTVSVTTSNADGPDDALAQRSDRVKAPRSALRTLDKGRMLSTKTG